MLLARALRSRLWWQVAAEHFILHAVEQGVSDKGLQVTYSPRKCFFLRGLCSSEGDHMLSMHKTFGSSLFSTIKMISEKKISKYLDLVKRCLQSFSLRIMKALRR